MLMSVQQAGAAENGRSATHKQASHAHGCERGSPGKAGRLRAPHLAGCSAPRPTPGAAAPRPAGTDAQRRARGAARLQARQGRGWQDDGLQRLSSRLGSTATLRAGRWPAPWQHPQAAAGFSHPDWQAQGRQACARGVPASGPGSSVSQPLPSRSTGWKRWPASKQGAPLSATRERCRPGGNARDHGGAGFKHTAAVHRQRTGSLQPCCPCIAHLGGRLGSATSRSAALECAGRAAVPGRYRPAAAAGGAHPSCRWQGETRVS